jgi:enamine deaminase RidA (YjgF/YER057c/UK114 family)
MVVFSGNTGATWSMSERTTRRVAFWMIVVAGGCLLQTMAAAHEMTDKISPETIRCIETAPGHSRAVVVGAVPLVHTAQLQAAPEGNLNEQLQHLLRQMDGLLQTQGSGLDRIVKLNCYLAGEGTRAQALEVLAEAFPGTRRPAVSFVNTRLPLQGSLVALDAVAVMDGVGAASANSGSAGPWNLSGPGAPARTLPPGPRVYVSGQAEPGDGTLADATRQTLASLGRTLEFLGLGKGDVVHVKSFLGPMHECAEVDREIRTFFEGHDIPPCAHVEWKSNLPIEIEMIVAAAANEPLRHGPSVEVRTPPGMTTPAIYSRLAIARHPQTVYTSGLYAGDPAASAEAQLRSLFANLKQCLDATGSDWMHLVKATYYVTREDLSLQHNVVRPDYFSPRRPPAASKAAVAGTGDPHHGITMDFIAVPGEP